MGLIPIAKQYRVSVLLANAFNACTEIVHPILEEYFANVNM